MSLVKKNKINSISPQLAPLPENCSPRLVDYGMLHHEASLNGCSERYGRGETSHTIHVWWARRPHSAMRALVFASLCTEITSNSLSLLNSISKLSAGSDTINKAQSKIAKQYHQVPQVLDMFGGGGTIPMEAATLGTEVFSIDANELSVFIQQCNLVYSQGINDNISDLLQESGNRVLTQLKEDSALLFPDRDKGFIAYLWSYSMRCPNCDYTYYLSKRPWLTKKGAKSLALKFDNSDNAQIFEITEVPKDYKMNSVWQGRTGKVKCPNCDQIFSNISIQTCQDSLMAVVKTGKKKGKQYLNAYSEPNNNVVAQIERQLLTELNISLPKSRLPRWSGIVNPSIYGIETHSDFLNPRQRIILLLLIKALKEEYSLLLTRYEEGTAKYIIGMLSSLIDQLVDWNCRLSMWISQNEQVGRAFCGPGISMLWDYAEIDPVQLGPANLWSKLDRIVTGAKSIPNFKHRPVVQLGFAQSLPFQNNFFDAIVTDPPYYDNIYYSVLADFFYSWKRLLFETIAPDLFYYPETDFSHELVASTFRNDTYQSAHENYCAELSKAIQEAARVLKPDGVFSFIYSHSSFNGWEAMIKAFRASPFVITSVQPLSIERKQRPRAMTSEAVNTCMVFVARKDESPKVEADIKKIIYQMQSICTNFSPSLINVGWNELDTALAVFAQGVALLSNAKSILGVKSDKEALKLIEELVKQEFNEFKLADRKSL